MKLDSAPIPWNQAADILPLLLIESFKKLAKIWQTFHEKRKYGLHIIMYNYSACLLITKHVYSLLHTIGLLIVWCAKHCT